MIKTPLKMAKTGLADEAQAWLKLSTPGAGPEPVGRPAACPGGLLYPLPAEAGAGQTGQAPRKLPPSGQKIRKISPQVLTWRPRVRYNFNLQGSVYLFTCRPAR